MAEKSTAMNKRLNRIKKRLWCLGAYLTLPELTTTEAVELVDGSQLGGIDKLVQIMIDQRFKIPLPYLRDVTVKLNRYLLHLEEESQDNPALPQDIEQGALTLNTALVQRERGIFKPDSVRYDEAMKAYVVAGTTTTNEETKEESLFCSSNTLYTGDADEIRTQLSYDDHREDYWRRIGWSEESRKMVDACGNRFIAFVTPSGGDVYKLMKAGALCKAGDRNELFRFLRKGFINPSCHYGIITSDRVRYQGYEEKDILVYNIGLGPKFERRIYADIRGKTDDLSGDYWHGAERALQDLFDTNDDRGTIRAVMEAYANENYTPYLYHQTAASLYSKFCKSDVAGERVLSLGRGNDSYDFGRFCLNADHDVGKPGLSFKVARSLREIEIDFY